MYGLKYSNQIQIIFKQIYLIHRKDPNRSNCTSQSGPGSNDNERVLRIRQITRTEASPLNTV